jgi:hypothetical protein
MEMALALGSRFGIGRIDIRVGLNQVLTVCDHQAAIRYERKLSTKT